MKVNNISLSMIFQLAHPRVDDNAKICKAIQVEQMVQALKM